MYNNSIYFKISIALTTLCFAISSGHAANILVLVPTISPSHLVIEMAVVKAMVERDHNVTVVSSLSLKTEWLHPSMTHIHLNSTIFDMDRAINATQGSMVQKLFKSVIMMNALVRAFGDTLDDPKILELISNKGNKFDIILYGYAYVDFYFGLAEHFDCPVALIWPNIPVTPIMRLIGNTPEIAYGPISYMNSLSSNDIKRPGFVFRLKNTLLVVFEAIMMYLPHKIENKVYG